MAKLFSDLADLKFEADAESARPLFKTPWLDDHIAIQQAKRDAAEAARVAAATAKAEAAAVAAAKAAEPPAPPSVLKEGIDPLDPNHPSNYFSAEQIGRSTVDERRTRVKTWMAQQADKYLTPFGVEQYRAELGRKQDNAFGLAKNTGIIEGAGDVGLSFGQGVVGAVKSLVGVFGDNAVSEKLGAVAEKLGSYKSNGAQIDSAALTAKIKEAEASGSTKDEILAYLDVIATQPLDTIAQGLGSLITAGVGKAAQVISLGSKAVQAGRVGAAATDAASRAATIGTRVNAAVGTAQGVGSVKGQQYETVLNEAKKQGFSNEKAQELASAAQAYTPENFTRQLLGGILGFVAGRTGAEASIIGGKAAGAGGRAVTVAKAGGTEAITEAPQSGQEAEAGNDAAIRAGLIAEDQRYRGVAGQSVQAAVLGGILGASVDIATGGGQVAKAAPAPAPVAPPVTPPPPPPAQNPGQNTPGAGTSNASTTTETVAKTEPEVKRTPEKTAERVDTLNTIQELSRVQNPTKQQTDRLKVARALAIEDGLATKGELDALAKNTTIGANGELSNSDGKVLDKDGLANSIPPVPDALPGSIDTVPSPAIAGANVAGNTSGQGQFQSSGRSTKAVEEIRAVYETLSPEGKLEADSAEQGYQEGLTAPTEIVATGRALMAAVGREVTYKDKTGTLTFDKTAGKYTVTAADGSTANILPSLGKITVPRDVSSNRAGDGILGELRRIKAREERDTANELKTNERSEKEAAIAQAKADAKTTIKKPKTPTVKGPDNLTRAVAEANARDAKNTTAKDLVGSFVQYQGAQGFLQERTDGLYVVDTKSNSDVFVESGLSQKPASELGMTAMTPPKSTTIPTPPRAAAPATAPTAPYVRPSNKEALAAGKAMDKGTKAATKQAAKLAKRTVPEQRFHDAVDMLVLEHGEEAAGYILDQIERKLGEGVKREKITKEIENAINNGYTPFSNAQSNVASTENNTQGQTTADGTGSTQGVAPLQNQAGTAAQDNRLNDVFAQQGVNAALDLIAKEGSIFTRSVIRTIRPFVQLITNVAQRPGTMQNGLMGEYNPTTRQIWLAPGATPHTFLHELVHAAVDTIMHTDINKLSERQRKAVVILNKMFAFAAANPRWEGRYAMTDVHEFIAEAMSNQQFQAELHSVSVQELLKRPNESMWTAFTDSIKRILGIDKETLSSSLLTTRRLLDDLVSAPTERRSEVLRLIGQTRQKAPAKTAKGFVANTRDRLGTAFGDYGYVGLNQLQDERDAALAAGDSKLAKAVEDVRQKIVLKDVAGSAERMAKDIAQPVEDLIKTLAKAGGMQPNDLRRVASEVAIAQHSLHLSKAWEEKAKAEVDATFEALENYGVVEGLRVKYEAQARSIAAEIDNFYNLSLGKPTEDIDAEFIANKINELDEMLRVLGEDVEAAGKAPGVSEAAASKMSAALTARRFGLRRSQDARRAIDAAHHQAQYLKTFLQGKPALAHKYEGMTQELRAWGAAQTQEPTMGPDKRLQFAGGHKLPGGMRIADAEMLITANAADPDGEAVNAVAEAYRNSFRQLAEKSVELGIVTPEAAAALREANPFYVNTQGTGETDIDANLNERNYRGFLDKAEGSSHYMNSNDVFTNLALRMNKLAQIDSSRALGKAAMKAINAGSTAWELHLPDQSGRNYVRATVGGQTVFLSPISKELDKTIGGPDAMNAALKKWAATPTRVYGQLFTTYTAFFAPLSYVRDGLTRTFNLRGRESELVREDGTFVSVAEARTRVGAQMANPVTWLEGFKHAYLGTNSPALQELIDAGGLTTFSEIVNTERKVEGQFAKGRGLERVKEEFVKWNKAFEVAQMLASYKGLRASGINQQQASFTGLDMMNFRRSGETTSGVLKAFYLYANPVAQDIRGFGRNIVDRNGKLKVWGAVDVGVMMGVGTMLFAMAREASDDDELGGKVIDSMTDKELYSVIPIKLSDSVTIKIPIGFGWPQVAYTWAVAKYRADRGLITESAAINDSLKAFFGTFAVTGISEASYQKDLPLALAQMVMPDLLAPVVAAASNKNFMGGPLTGRLKDDVNKADQGKWRTPEAYKQIAQAVQSTTGIDFAPESVQAVATGYAAGLFGVGLDLALGLEQDRKEKGLSKDFAPTAVERALGLSRWYTRSDENKQAQAAFYREKERITEMQKDFNSEAPKGLGREDAAAKMARLARGGAAPEQVKQIESLAAYDKASKLIQERWKQADARRKGGEDISFLAEGIVADEVALQTKFVKVVRDARGEK